MLKTVMDLGKAFSFVSKPTPILNNDNQRSCKNQGITVQHLIWRKIYPY